MGWTKPTTKAFDAGELPNKKKITDEQSERLDKYAPKDTSGKLMGIGAGDMDDFQQKALDDIIAIGEQHEEIMGHLNDLLEHHPNPETIINVFDNDYEQTLRDEYDKVVLSASFDDVLEVALKRFIMPMAFYFGIGDPTGKGQLNVVISPITTWDATKTLERRELVERVAPDFLTEVDDFIYDFGDMSPSDARKEMLRQGFIENHDIAG